MAKHYVDETAEFAMPRVGGRHAVQDAGEPVTTQRFDAGFREQRRLPALQARSDDEGR